MLELLHALVDRDRAPGSADGVEVQISAHFAGAAPALTLDPLALQRLADAGAALGLTLRPLDLLTAAKVRATRQQGRRDSEMTLSYRVTGQFAPDDFSKSVGIEPSGVVRQGEARRAPARSSLWKVQIGPVSLTVFPETTADHLLAKLEAHSSQLKTTTSRLGLGSFFRYSIVYVDGIPTVRVSREQLRRISNLQCTLQIITSVPRESESTIEF